MLVSFIRGMVTMGPLGYRFTKHLLGKSHPNAYGLENCTHVMSDWVSHFSDHRVFFCYFM